jgi:hypothetical protein
VHGGGSVSLLHWYLLSSSAFFVLSRLCTFISLQGLMGIVCVISYTHLKTKA